MEYMKRKDYEAWIASTRDARMDWWRKARFGMFVHFGLYSILGRHEWVMSMEGIDKEDYEKLADQFLPEEGCCEKWARLLSLGFQGQSLQQCQLRLPQRYREGIR